MYPSTAHRRGDHTCRCKCQKCQSGKHCHNLAAGCKASHW